MASAKGKGRRKLKYLASHNPAIESAHRQHVSQHAPGNARLRTTLCSRLYLAVTLLLLLVPASDINAQSGRRTQTSTTTPSSTQRPRRATTGTPQQKSPATNQPSSSASKQSNSTPVSILPDDAPPPPVYKPKPQPQASASADAGDEIDVGDVVRITSNLVTVPASVVDNYGRALTGLRLEDFELRVDGQVKSITEISYSDTPVRLALLFDNSASQSVAREFEKQAATRFFRSVMRPTDQGAVFSVYTEVDLVQPLTSNIPALVRAIESFGRPEGATRLFDAIVQAANYLRPQAGRKVIIIVSDGEDTLSDTDFEETLRIAQAADCQIYAIQTKQIEYVMQTGQPMGNANLRSLAAERRMQEFSAQTGGAVYAPLAVGELDAAFAQISADLSQQYVLSYYPTDEKLDGRFRTISLKIRTHPDARVRARKGYYASRAAMRSGINWQTIPASNGTTSTSLNTSDTVPKDVTATTAPVSSSTLNVSPAPAVKVNTSAPPTATTPVQGTPAPPASQSSAKPQNQQTTQPSSTQNSARSSSQQQQSQAQPPAQSQPAQTGAPETAAQKPVSGGVLNGKALSLPKPDYPVSARTAGAAGTVVVEVIVDETGKVTSAKALSGHMMLRASAVAAARLARFAPTKLSGQPVKVTGVISYNFMAR